MSRASNQKVNAELFSLEPTALLEFFIIYYDYINRPDDKLYIHGGTNGINGSVYWQGQEYLPFPIQSSGFESRGDGTLPRPKLMVSNQDFFVSNLIRRYNNLVGAKVVRKRVFLKFLDAVNFSDGINPYGSADSTAGLEDQVFFILRRSAENRAIVEFELASPLEIENVTFPRRTVMARYCSFHYRGNGCRYMGPPIADENDQQLTAKEIKFTSGLIRRRYNTSDNVEPSNSAQFTSKIAAAPFQTPDGEDVVTSIAETVTYNGSSYNVIGFPVYAADNYYLEYLGYFKVDYSEGGEYYFGVDPDDAAEIFIDGRLIAGDYGKGPRQGSGPQGTTGSIILKEGHHRVLVRFYENGGTQNPNPQGLTVFYKTPGSSTWTSVPAARWYYNPSERNLLTSSQRFFSSSPLDVWVSIEIAALRNAANKGLWKMDTNYKTGDYVYIENPHVKVAKKNINEIPNWTPLLKFYMCVKTHTATGSKHPSFSREFWVSDQCSKSINGCKLRFGDDGVLPFGGFPGTEEYAINQ
jgi:lambda family phage minor tail protein L